MLTDANQCYPTPIRRQSDVYPTLSDACPTTIRLLSDAYPTPIRRLSDDYPTPIRSYPTPSDAHPTPIRCPSDTHLALSDAHPTPTDAHPTPIRRRSDAIKRCAVVATPIQRSGRQMSSILKPHGQAICSGPHSWTPKPRGPRGAPLRYQWPLGCALQGPGARNAHPIDP